MAVYATTIYAQEGKEDEVARRFQELGGLMKGAEGYRGRHVLRAESNGGADAGHFISIEIWESPEARAAHRKTDEFQAWYKGFTPNLRPEHTHGFYQDIGADH
ncbi:MAG: antibiotic biosynthesis monooxygenase family protein [Dehalococcoidia bacterium]